LLDLLARAATGDLVIADGRSGRARVGALEAEGLIELRRGAYRATAAGLRALEDRGRAPGPSWPVAVLFTDVVGSSRMIEQLGERDAHDRLRRHFALLRVAIAGHSGNEVKSLGDGLMVVFGAAADAVACAAAMQSAVAREHDGLGLRIGIHAGEPVREDDDYFGTAVIVARRLCDSACAGQTLVSELIQRLAAEHEFEPVGDLALKGLSDPVPAGALVGWCARSLERSPAVAVTA
jgi:class 3 adenylate cyclase